ncbi:MAG: NAD(P)/FAD-dependent oxidoreductase [Acetobacteraceae bacterium]
MPTNTLIIIGAGAAGLTAAAHAATAGLSTLLIDRMGGGGELMNLGPLHDVPDSPTGPDLMAQLMEQAVTAGAELAVAEVTALTQTPMGWQVTTDSGTHTADAVILAPGLAPGTLGLGNEADFEGMGLSHCAACDGPLYTGQAVVVAGADRWAVQEARDLAESGCSVTLIAPEATPEQHPNLTVIQGRITALEGANGLDAIHVQPAAGGAPQRLPTPVLFVQTGRRPALAFAPAALARDADGRIVTDAALRTSLPNLLAAGDARAGAPRTLVAAMEDGKRAAAALSPLGNSAA